jgi:hypothetical protein
MREAIGARSNSRSKVAEACWKALRYGPNDQSLGGAGMMVLPARLFDHPAGALPAGHCHAVGAGLRGVAFEFRWIGPCCFLPRIDPRRAHSGRRLSLSRELRGNGASEAEIAQ